jgi:hypothetical protein
MVPHQHSDGVPTPRNAPTKDHLEPRTYGGPTTLANLVAACCQCNNLRGEIEVQAFRNLLRKWFKRDPTLHARWHTISAEELRTFKYHCMYAHARQLNGLAIRSIEHAFRHSTFTYRCRRYIPFMIAHHTRTP